MTGATDDEHEFGEYFAARYDRVRRVAYLMCGDWHRADDLAQAAFIRLARSWQSVHSHNALDSFVRTCLIRAAVDESRRPWRRERAVPALPDIAGVGGDDEASARRLLISAALQQVPARQRAVLVCRFYEDLDVAETAATLKCSTGTVKSQTARGLATLRRLLGEAFDTVGALPTAPGSDAKGAADV
ncbi:SigE family RNA polymerase sigma factor [Dactylosporangium sp. AC04546]|uniref:SigE family RNA polymerase sigma factor n=1 Tax=Dactylosporangium sp. AC04546 TaxID=2862460 RepID=UPI001EE0081E|nr:SigE family RNA polymerase sigma factor [Dactylosporangium sp. AC04546]WVK82618.1 SigE family RNA polymerase sigma factor [Dactylosporangium sp. AC04546]